MGHQLTQQDIDKMEAEIEHRKLVVRKELLEAVKEARAQGDLSDNFEYYAAKREKNRNEGRIRYLDRMIRTATIVEAQTAPDEVGIGDEIIVEFEEDHETESLRLVTTVASDSLNNCVSIEAPIGKSIRGHKVGERVYVEMGKNAGFYLCIKEIRKASKEH